MTQKGIQGLMKKYVLYALRLIWGNTTKSQKVTGVAYIVTLSVRGSILDVNLTTIICLIASDG